MKSIVCFVLTFLFASAAFAQNTQTVFNDAQGTFNITVPSTWRVKKQPGEDLRFEASRGADIAFEYVAISAKPLPGGDRITPTAFANMFLLQGKPADWQVLADATYPDAKIISKGPAKLGRQDAIFLITEGNVQLVHSELLERTYSVVTLFRGEIFNVSFSAAANKFPSLLPEYEKIVASVVLKQGK